MWIPIQKNSPRNSSGILVAQGGSQMDTWVLCGSRFEYSKKIFLETQVGSLYLRVGPKWIPESYVDPNCQNILLEIQVRSLYLRVGPRWIPPDGSLSQNNSPRTSSGILVSWVGPRWILHGSKIHFNAFARRRRKSFFWKQFLYHMFSGKAGPGSRVPKPGSGWCTKNTMLNFLRL